MIGLALVGTAFVLQGSGTETPPDPPAVVDLGTATATPVPATATPAPVVANNALGDQPYRLVIDKAGVNAPVDEYGLDANAYPAVPTGGDAKSVVAWYNFSARPGTGGNAVFAGHVTWNGPAVFYNLTKLAQGDTVRLQGTDGTELTYTISSVYSIDPRDPDSVRVMDQTDHDAVTIMTCTGTFIDTNEPIFGGHYTNTLVVRGELSSVSGGPAAGG